VTAPAASAPLPRPSSASRPAHRASSSASSYASSAASASASEFSSGDSSVNCGSNAGSAGGIGDDGDGGAAVGFDEGNFQFEAFGSASDNPFASAASSRDGKLVTLGRVPF
jgi:hypothetical protein